MRTIRRMIPWLALLLVVGFAAEALGCPNCKEAVAGQDGDAMRLANGYSWSIILMISMPFILLGTGMMMIARAVIVFPEPVSPTTPCISPGRRHIETPSRIRSRDREPTMSTVRSRTSRVGATAAAAPGSTSIAYRLAYVCRTPL